MEDDLKKNGRRPNKNKNGRQPQFFFFFLNGRWSPTKNGRQPQAQLKK